MSDAPHDEARQMARQHIFVVNGAPPFLDLIRELLQGEQYNVTTTNFLPRTFAQIEVLAPDLLIIDLAVGIEAGWNLLDELQTSASTRGIPVIVFSTSPRLLDQARALDAPAARRRFLPKPFDIAALLALVEELIGPA